MAFSYTRYDVKVPTMGDYSSATSNFESTNANVDSMEIINDSEVEKVSVDIKSKDEITRSRYAIVHAGANVATSVFSLFEGIYFVLEKLSDIGYFIYRGINVPIVFLSETFAQFLSDKLGINYEEYFFTKNFIKDTKAYVAKEHTKSVVDKFFNNTSIGAKIKINSSGYDFIRKIGNEFGKVSAVVVVSALTAGLGAGAAAGEGLAIGETSISGTMTGFGAASGFGGGLEKAFDNNASVGKGLVSAAASGLWEGAQYYTGGKIAGITPTVSATKNALIRVGLDSTVGAVDGFVNPAIDSIYSGKKYSESFQENGGFKNVMINAGVAGVLSGIGEKSLRNYLLFGNVQSKVKGDIDPIYRERLIKDFDKLFKNDNTSNHDVIDYYINMFKSTKNKEKIHMLESIVNEKKKNGDFRLTMTDYFDGSFYLGVNTDGYKKLCLNTNTVITKEQYTGSHEMGHLLHHYLLDNQYPDNLEEILNNSQIFSSTQGLQARVNFENKLNSLWNNYFNGAGKEYYDKFIIENFGSEEDYSEFLSDNIYSLIKDYKTKEMPRFLQLMGFSYQDVNHIEKALFDTGNIHERMGLDFDNFLYLSSSIESHQKAIIKYNLTFNAFHKDYGDYLAISDIIDAVYKGDSLDKNITQMNLLFKHGQYYYLVRDEKAPYQEMIANYVSLKTGSNPQMIDDLRSIVGDEIVDELEKTYQLMKNNGLKKNLNSSFQTINDAKNIIKNKTVNNVMNGDYDDR